MNKLKYIILILPALLFSACEKDTTPETTVLEIRTDDPTDYGRKSITLNGTISNIETIKEDGFLFWKTGEKEYAAEVTCEDISSHLNAVVDGLETGESYLYCLYVGNGINRMMADTKSFQTPTVGAPLVSKVELISDKTVRATINDDGIDETGKHIVAKGFCWNTTGRPTVFDQKVVVDSVSFEATLSGIQSNTDYYVRAFAQNDSSYLAYGPELKINIESHGINSLEEFQMFRDFVNNRMDISSWLDNGTVYLNCDLDMSGVVFYDEFMINYCDFTFDGNNHTIKINSFYPNGHDENTVLGFFNSITETGVVKNLNIDYTGDNFGVNYISNSASIGNIAGYNHGIIENCTSHKTSFYVGPSDKTTNVGGICAYNYGTIKGCSNYGDITGSWNVGGICAFNSGRIEDCKNYGTITNKYYENGGGDGANGIGLTGENSVISNCENHGIVTGEGSWNSGIGSAIDGASITNCRNYGEVYGYNTASGISAEISRSGSVSNCTNSGSITLMQSNYNYNKCVGGTGGYVGYTVDGSSTPGTLLNCQNTGHITDNSARANIGNIAGVIDIYGTVTGSKYGGTVNGVAGTKANAIGEVRTGGTFKNSRMETKGCSMMYPIK